MSILNLISDNRIWYEFYDRLKMRGKMRQSELERLLEFIDEERYLGVLELMINKEGFSLPSKHLVNKVNNTRKRVVYTFSQDENYVLKLLSYLLYKYDGAFSSNLFSFRKNFGVKRAFSDLLSYGDISKMYVYKVDIHDYFNSIDIDICLRELKEVIGDDVPLYEFISRLLKEDRVIYNGAVISDSHGIMAGVPISSFLANVYLRKMDEYFENHRILYARYSDDIIVFAQDKSELLMYVKKIKAILSDYKLDVNPKKEIYTDIGEAWSFLGIEFYDGVADIAPVSLNKLKAKFRRKSRALLRWKRKKGTENLYAARAFVKYVNRYLYSNSDSDELTWSRWYFPIITTDKSLKEIDKYTLELIRYIMAEKHSKSAYNLRYQEIKNLGYTPLVGEYYKAKR